MIIGDIFNGIPPWINPAMSVNEFKLIQAGAINSTLYYRAMDADFCQQVVEDYADEIFLLLQKYRLGEVSLSGDTWPEFCKAALMAATEIWVVNLQIKTGEKICSWNLSSTALH